MPRSEFIFRLDTSDPVGQNPLMKKATTSEKEGVLKVEWNERKLEIPVKPQAPSNTFI
jgi:hypothetical protein